MFYIQNVIEEQLSRSKFILSTTLIKTALALIVFQLYKTIVQRTYITSKKKKIFFHHSTITEGLSGKTGSLHCFFQNFADQITR